MSLRVAPEIKNTEDQSDHDDVPGSVPQRPGSQEQFSNAVKGCADGDVFEHEQAVGQKEQPTGHAAHQHLPVPEQTL